MAIVQCGRHHFYDNEKFPTCPHCANPAASKKPMMESVSAAWEAQQVERYAAEYLRQNLSNRGTDIDEEKTVGIYAKQGRKQYVCGWLVCVKGEEYGRDFPLYAGFNRMGRAKSNDVALQDPQIAEEEHCSVIYEEKKNVFYLFPKPGYETYLDGTLISQAEEIRGGEKIAIGSTELEFVAFCTGDKKWKKIS